MNNYSKLEEKFREVMIIKDIKKVLLWDNAVIMPKKSIDKKTDQLNYLTNLSYNIVSSKEIGDLIDNIDINILSNLQKANFAEIKRIRNNTILIPVNLLQKFENSSIKSEMIWREARKNNDFKLFLPYLKNNIDLTREIAQIKSENLNCDIYEACMDDYDPGMRISTIDYIFNDLEKFLPKFIDEVIEHQNKVNVANYSIDLSMSIKLQKKLGRFLMNKLGFDFDRGRIDTSIHPFCGGISGDVRITSRYDKKNFISGIMGVIHETGHGIYEQNLPNELEYQPLSSTNSMSTHESQSLIYEMQIGRSLEFIEYLANIIKQEANLEIDPKILYREMNKVKKSYIRVDADEVTYPVHIIIRYKIEKSLIKNELKPEEIPYIWNEYMQQMLQLKIYKDSEGCMQDTHWPSGMFGYFPSYSIGAIMANQFFCEMNKSIPKNNIKEGNFSPYKTWLNENIHKHGIYYKPIELIENISQKAEFNTELYKSYLYNKFIENYN